MSLQSIVRHTKDIFWQDVVDDVVMLSMENGQYYGAETTGAIIWRLMDEPITVASICETLLSDFDVDKATCETEVLGFVEQLRSAGLIEIVSQ